jgi:lantibiotic biosynthesis protein
VWRVRYIHALSTRRTQAIRPVTANASAGLFYGAPAVAFVLHTAAHPVRATMLAALDEHINDLTALKLAAAYERMDRGELTRPSEYDLISGLAGLGLYHLVRHGPRDRRADHAPGQAGKGTPGDRRSLA